MNQLIQIKGGFVERITRVLEKTRYIQARTPSELDSIYHLRYEANLREGTIGPLESKRLIDHYDDVDNVYNFGIYVDGILTSAMRAHVVSQRSPYSPAFEVYHDLLAEKVDKGAVIIDGNRLVADYARSRLFPQLPYITLRLGIMAAEHFGADIITASVRTEHFPFYQREYFAKKLCEPRPYPTLTKPLSLICIDYRNDRDAINERHGFYASTALEREAIFGGDDTNLGDRQEMRILDAG